MLFYNVLTADNTPVDYTTAGSRETSPTTTTTVKQPPTTLSRTVAPAVDVGQALGREGGASGRRDGELTTGELAGIIVAGISLLLIVLIIILVTHYRRRIRRLKRQASQSDTVAFSNERSGSVSSGKC